MLIRPFREIRDLFVNMKSKTTKIIISVILCALQVILFSRITMASTGKVISQEEQILAKMSLHEKICQMFIVFPSDITGVYPVTEAGEITKNALQEYPVGGILYDESNMKSSEQLKGMAEKSQSFSKIPMFIVCDEEGGRVTRIQKILGGTDIQSMYSYKDQGVKVAENNAASISDSLKKHGFNMDFAPVADVWSNPNNKVIGNRAYSDNFEQAATLVAGAVKGFNEKGIVCTLKHFPGHGDTLTDSHHESVFINKSLTQLKKEELRPFQAGIAAGADMVMLGHLTVSQVDEKPILMSEKWIKTILRNEMGFKGIVITDSLKMDAISKAYGNDEVVVSAIKSGVDILLCPSDFKSAVKAVENAVKNGDISEESINESVKRILKTKISKGIIK